MRRNAQRNPRRAGESETQGLPAPRIVVGVDGSAESVRALVWAAAEARLKNAVLDIVHVDVFRHEVMDLFGPEMLRSERGILEDAVARARSLEPSIAVDSRLCEPPVGEALIEASENAEMLVVGSSGAGGFRRLALGSVSAECARDAKCPVVIIPSLTRLVPAADETPEEASRASL